MKPLRLLALTLSIAATAWLAAAVFACDGAKSASASSCSGTKASATKSASASSCGAHATTATAASASAKHAGCPAAGNCPMSAEACKAAMASGACTAEMQAACARGAKSAKMASAGACTMHAMAAHSDCAVCSDEMACDDDVHATGAHAQVVALRNGTMIVYTAEGAENVRDLQATVARHNDAVIATLKGDAKLCTACKKLRGALASGKLVREVVNVERGCQVIVTSSDRSIVQQVHSCTNAQVAARTRS